MTPAALATQPSGTLCPPALPQEVRSQPLLGCSVHTVHSVRVLAELWGARYTSGPQLAFVHLVSRRGSDADPRATGPQSLSIGWVTGRGWRGGDEQRSLGSHPFSYTTDH